MKFLFFFPLTKGDYFYKIILSEGYIVLKRRVVFLSSSFCSSLKRGAQTMETFGCENDALKKYNLSWKAMIFVLISGCKLFAFFTHKEGDEVIVLRLGPKDLYFI